MKELEERLEARKIVPTAVRLLILREMLKFRRAFSLSDLENSLDTVDRSTLYRTLVIFHDKHLIHSIDDGTGSVKYSVCSEECKCAWNDLHVHFYCNACLKTYCLESIPIPSVSLPPGFTISSANFVLKGCCSRCNKKHAT